MENITVPKELFDNLLVDFERLLNDFEQIAEQDTVKVAQERLTEIEAGGVKALTEKDFIEFMNRVPS